MKCVGLSLALLGAILMSVDVANAQAPSWSPPPESQRCPSKWGANDERGSATHMTAQRVLDAVKLIKTGEVIELGHVLNNNMPFPGGRTFELHTLRTLMNQPSNRRGSNESCFGGSRRKSHESRSCNHGRIHLRPAARFRRRRSASSSPSQDRTSSEARSPKSRSLPRSPSRP